MTEVRIKTDPELPNRCRPVDAKGELTRSGDKCKGLRRLSLLQAKCGQFDINLVFSVDTTSGNHIKALELDLRDNLGHVAKHTLATAE